MKYLLIICLFFASCARVPIQSVELSEALKEESDRMHMLNLSLVDKLFREKVHQVNEFITNEYTPAFLENFKKVLPADVDFEADFEELMQAVYPKINATKDSLIDVLQEQKTTIIDKLNQDYGVYSSAYTEMQNLLRSASKLGQQRTEVFQQLKALSNNRLDLEAIDNAINKFIKGGGSIGAKAVELSDTLNKLLKK